MQLSVTGQGFTSQICLILPCFLPKCNSRPVFILVSGANTDSIILIQVQFLQTGRNFYILWGVPLIPGQGDLPCVAQEHPPLTGPASWCWLVPAFPRSAGAGCRRHRLSPSLTLEPGRSLCQGATLPADTGRTQRGRHGIKHPHYLHRQLSSVRFSSKMGGIP